MKKIQYRTGEDDIGQRVDAVLARQFPEFSRSAWQQKLKMNPALVNNNPVNSSYKVTINQDIEAILPESKVYKIAFHAPKVLPKIIYQDDNVIVVDKPAGLIAHPTDANPTEESMAGAFFDQITDDNPLRPGIVHRLDRDTSGVMILARNPETKKFLQEQFRNRKVSKHYTALVQGHLKQDQARIELPLQKSQRQPNTMVVHPGGRPAITEYKVMAQYHKVSLVDVSIHTGRTHQIRAHFAHLGHPVIGDTVYGRDTRPKGLNRQFLHANSLTIMLPNKGKQTFVAELPKDLKNYLELL